MLFKYVLYANIIMVSGGNNMKRINFYLLKRHIATVLCMAFILGTLSFVPSASADEDAEASQVLSRSSVPDAVGYDNAIARSHVKRLYADEGNELNKVIFLNSDGSKTAYIFGYPVKYTDSDGNINDISLDIASVSNGSFKSKNGCSTTVFSKNIKDGITLSGMGEKISLYPQLPTVYAESLTANGSSGTQAASIARLANEKTVSYTYDSKTDIEYSLTYTGFKEDIVVKEYTGQTEYEFILNTNGLTLERINGSYCLTDENGTVKATVGDIVIFTSDNRNNTFGTIDAKTVRANERYLLTIHIDSEYLSDPKTKYPIRIDPTIEVNYSSGGAGAISDVTINSLDDCAPSSRFLYVGKRQTYGISRILMKFPGLDLSTLGDDVTITKAVVELRDVMCEESEFTVRCHKFFGNAWNESTVDWSNVDPNSYSSYMSRNIISYAVGNSLQPKFRYEFDVKLAIIDWSIGNSDPEKGIIFTAMSDVENGTTYASRTFASFNNAADKPSLVITYTTSN